MSGILINLIIQTHQRRRRRKCRRGRRQEHRSRYAWKYHRGRDRRRRRGTDPRHADSAARQYRLDAGYRQHHRSGRRWRRCRCRSHGDRRRHQEQDGLTALRSCAGGVRSSAPPARATILTAPQNPRPYPRRLTATTRQPLSSRSIRVSDSGSITKRSAASGARSSAMASTARMVPECTTRTTSPAGSSASPRACARDLIDKTFAAGRPVARRRFPEFPIGIAELGGEIVVAPSGPGAKILFAKGGLFDRIEPERAARFPASGAPGCKPHKRVRRQSAP